MAQADKNTTLTIRILGRDYPVACPPDEREALLSSAEYLSKRMLAIQKKGKTLGLDRIAVMAALNTSRELLSLRQEVEQLRAEVEHGSAWNSAPPASNPPQDSELNDRLSQLQLRIDSALEGSD